MQHFSLIRLRPLFLKSPPRVGSEGGPGRALRRRCEPRSQKKRRQQSRRGNTVSENPTGFSKKKPPCPTESSTAAESQKIESFVYCPLSSVVASRFCSLFPLYRWRVDCYLSIRLKLSTRDRFFIIPSSVHHRSGIRSLESRRSCAPSSDRSSRSSTGRDSLPAGTADRVRSAVRDDSR
jgi:hypothetical protein